MFKKIILSLLIIALTLPYFYMAADAPKAQAQYELSEVTAEEMSLMVIEQTAESATAAARTAGIGIPTYDIPAAAGGVVEHSVQNTVKSSNVTIRRISDALKKFLLAFFKRFILDRIVDQIIDWISGAGEPQFVTNPEQFLREAANQGAGEAIRAIIPELCEPFGLKVDAYLKIPTFSQAAQCTFTEVVGNIQSFYDNFQDGGWLGYSQAWQPQNNFYGASIIAEQEMRRAALARKESASAEIQMGQGFLSVKQCSAGSGFSATDVGLSDSDLINKGFVKDMEGKYCESANLQTVTPGQFVGQMAIKGTAAKTFDFILTADELEEYLSAIIDAAIGRLIKEGFAAVKGSGTTYTDSAGVVTDYEEKISTGFKEYTKDTNIATLKSYQDSLDDLSVKQKEPLIKMAREDYKKLQKALKPVVDIETGSLAKARQLSSKYQKKGCEVGPAQLSWVDGKINKLIKNIGVDDVSTKDKDETGDLRIVLGEINEQITQIALLDSSYIKGTIDKAVGEVEVAYADAYGKLTGDIQVAMDTIESATASTSTIEEAIDDLITSAQDIIGLADDAVNAVNSIYDNLAATSTQASKSAKDIISAAQIIEIANDELLAMVYDAVSLAAQNSRGPADDVRFNAALFEANVKDLDKTTDPNLVKIMVEDANKAVGFAQDALTAAKNEQTKDSALAADTAFKEAVSKAEASVSTAHVLAVNINVNSAGLIEIRDLDNAVQNATITAENLASTFKSFKTQAIASQDVQSKVEEIVDAMEGLRAAVGALAGLDTGEIQQVIKVSEEVSKKLIAEKMDTIITYYNKFIANNKSLVGKLFNNKAKKDAKAERKNINKKINEAGDNCQ